MSLLSFKAGPKALKHIRENGLNPDDIEIVAGAAGAAKWLVLSQLDRYLFTEFFSAKKTPLHLLGSSIGAWRFAAVSQKDPLAAIAKLEEAYIEQRYSTKPDAKEVTQKSFSILESFLSDEGISEILEHPRHRLSFLSVRSHPLVASDRKWPLLFGLGAAAFSNAVHSRGIHTFFERTLFYDSRSSPPFLHAEAFRSQKVKLSRENFRKALMSSGSIPLIMSGITDIEGARPGIYRDGGLIDYHLNVPFLPEDSRKIVLFPHFEDKFIPGWFDKQIPWRKHHPARMASVLTVAPSQEFIARLPFGKIPDRKDFYKFQGRDAERIKYWRTVTQECQRLVDDFQQTLAQGTLGDKVSLMV